MNSNKHLTIAAKSRDFGTVRTLVESGVNPNEPLVWGNPKSPLMYAVEAGDCEFVTYLLNVGADANARGYYGIYALVLAAANGFAEVVEALLAHGAEITPRNPFDAYNGPRALVVAALQGHKAAASLLVDAGADINVGFRFAAKGGHCELLRYFAQHGADINAIGNCYEASASYNAKGTFTIGGGIKESTALDLPLQKDVLRL